jgi:hypothetical protein
MHLEVTQSGGFAGLSRHWSTEIPDSECIPLVTALRQADRSGENRPDERLYEIHLGDISVSIPEHRTHHGALAMLVQRAQHDNHGR